MQPYGLAFTTTVNNHFYQLDTGIAILGTEKRKKRFDALPFGCVDLPVMYVCMYVCMSRFVVLYGRIIIIISVGGFCFCSNDQQHGASNEESAGVSLDTEGRFS